MVQESQRRKSEFPHANSQDYGKIYPAISGFQMPDKGRPAEASQDVTAVFRGFVKGHTLDYQRKYRIEEKSEDEEIESLNNSSERDEDEVI